MTRSILDLSILVALFALCVVSGCDSADESSSNGGVARQGLLAPNYSMAGPCKAIINQGGSMADPRGFVAGPGSTHYPTPDDSNPSPGHPIGNANLVGECLTNKCAACN